MADEQNEDATNGSAKIEPTEQEVPPENVNGDKNIDTDKSTENNDNNIKNEPGSGDQSAQDESNPPENEAMTPAPENTEDDNAQTNVVETTDASPTDQPHGQPPEEPSDQTSDQPTKENDVTQEGEVIDGNTEAKDNIVPPEAAETDDNQQSDEVGAKEPENIPAHYDPIIEEEEEGATPDIKIANKELMEEPHIDDDDDDDDQLLRDKEFPDAYSTPPPPERTTDDNDSQSYGADRKEDSGSESSPEFPIFDRAQLLERYKEAREERLLLQNMNNQLQHKLAEYFKKKKTDERVQEMEKSVTDQEQRYLKYISNLQELQQEERRQLEEIKAQKEDMNQRCLEKQDKVMLASDEFFKFKHDVAKSAINSRSGKPIAPKDSETLQTLESKKEEEVRQVRLDNIKLKNKLRKKELLLKAKEELAEGLHLIDFEQLKIENQTYNEKIEERNEEILKLRKKITTTVQVLTHLKEKLQFVQGENSEQRNRLKYIEANVAQKRDILTRTKQVRDALRIDNLKLKQKCGLLGNKSLLRDFEVRKEEGNDLAEKLTELKTNHTSLSMNLNGVKKKITQTRINSA